MIRGIGALLLLALPVWAQQAPPLPPSKALFELRKAAIAELAKLRAEFLKKNAKADVVDCDNIGGKLLTPSKPMPERGGSAPHPGEAVYDEVLGLWVEAGKELAKLYKEGGASLKDKEAEEAATFAGWFETWPECAKGIQQLNRRRKFMKLAPVTQDWANSIGGYLHGTYLTVNKDHPTVKGLGAHNEDRKLPAYTQEGEKAAGGILAWGTDGPGTMDVWLNSRFHRSPVMDRDCGRVAFGGRRQEGWSCRSMGGMAGRPLAELITWPGDGDTEIPTSFGSELPNPFPPGVTSSGTVIVADFGGRQPKKPEWRLLDPEKKPVEILNLDLKSPICFVAKSVLAAKTKYTVEVVSADGQRFTWSFTTR